MSPRCRVRALVYAALCFSAVVGAPLCRADGQWTGTLVATSDFVFRGISESYGEPALQGAVNYQSRSGWFAGGWASNVNPYPFDVASGEVNVEAGFGWTLSRDWAARASYSRYLYLWDRRAAEYDYGEVALTLGFEDWLAATISYQPDSTRYTTLGYVKNRPATAYEVTGRWPLPRNFSLAGGIGYYDLTHLYRVSYWSGNAGASYVRGHFEFDLTRFFGDRTVRRLFEDAAANGRWVATVVWRF